MDLNRNQDVHYLCGSGAKFLHKWQEVLASKLWSQESFLKIATLIKDELRGADCNVEYRITDNNIIAGTYPGTLGMAASPPASSGSIDLSCLYGKGVETEMMLKLVLPTLSYKLFQKNGETLNKRHIHDALNRYK